MWSSVTISSIGRRRCCSVSVRSAFEGAGIVALSIVVLEFAAEEGVMLSATDLSRSCCESQMSVLVNGIIDVQSSDTFAM